MAKQLNVNLAFSADTSKAKAQIRDLQAELTKLSTASTIGNFNNADMEKAIFAAKSLQMHLNNAVNVDTGKLDLSRFSKSLNSSNQKLETLRHDLSLAGEQGNQAFLQLARSISQAEAPAIRISNTFREIGNTLKNTIRWQLSSSMLHGFMGAVQSAYGYAQDLDESLNNIRIVTGQSKEEMAEFAEQANKAAKALNTTTTAYTNAALIYYQQGDSDATVLEKTDVTAKMANVTGQSAEIVSDQLTAIWNNFNKSGEESYEKYADILTALGAATASSTDEIAGGLEKFASIADMIGLSYEYAVTALATITATTRQSEDVVGTALKTIFARIQGLSLGETLDDGTNLNKYSKALAKVGISIKDQNGELKNMDNILNEMGAKWQTLSKDQQVALAQTVAGVRQYNQLVSLMDNWDYFGENLAIAQGSEGALDAQAAIYAESWEAASKRVQAATEDVFDSLIDDDFFISLTNGTAEFVDGIGQVVDALGGMKGIITLISSIFLTNFSKEIPSTIQKLTENFNVLTGKAQQDAISMMEQNQRALEGFTSDNMTNALGAELTSLTKVNEMKTSLAKTSHLLTEAERQQFEQEIQMVETAGQLVAKEGEKVDAIEKEIAANERRLISEAARNKQSLDGSGPRISNLNGDKAQADEIRAKLAELKKLTQEYVACEQVIKRLDIANATWLTSGEVSAKSMVKNMTVFKQSFIEARGGVDKLTDAEKQMCDTLKAEIKEANGDVNKLKKAFENFGNGIKSSLNPVTFDLLDKEIADIEQALRNLGVDNEALNNLEQQFREGAISTDEYRQKLLALANTESQSVTHATTKMSETIGFLGAKMMQVSMAFNTLKSAWTVWNDEDAALMEKILTTMTALGTVIPIVTAATNADNAAQTLNHGINLANLAVKSKLPIISALGAKASIALTAAKTGETAAVAGNTAAWAANPIGWIAFAVMGAIAAFTALIAVLKLATEWIIKGNKIETENCETLIENAEKTKELAEANEELGVSMENLIKQYEEMSKAGENTAETLVDIKAQIPELIKSYKELAESMGMPVDAIEDLQNAANLAILTGDFSDFNKQKEVLDSQLAIGTAKSAKSGSVAASTALAAKMQEEQGRVSGSSYSVHVGGVDAGFNEEYEAVDILKREMGDYASKDISGDGIDLKVNNYSDPLEMVDYYEKMVAARDAMLKEMDQTQLQHSDTFREINELIAATASEYQTAKEQADEYINVAGKALIAELGDGSAISSMEDYLAYREEYIKLAQESYGLTQEQAEAYLEEQSSLSKVAKEYQLATIMAEKFANIDTKDARFQEQAKDYYTSISDYLKQTYGELNDLELTAAVNVAMNADSIEDFAEQFQHTMIQVSAQSYATSANIAQQVMTQAAENNNFNFTSLLNDDNFLEYLNKINVSQVALTQKTYEEQYAIVSGYYNDLNTLMFDATTAQQELYYQTLADAQRELNNYLIAMSGDSAEKIEQDKARFAALQSQLQNTTDENQIKSLNEQMDILSESFKETYGFEIESNAATIQNEIDNILDSIEELQNKKIEMAMDWSGIDELEVGMKKASEFASFIQKDTKKTGDSYEMTAAQAKEWLKFYPELGAIAKTTNEGIIKMDAAQVDAFIKGKEDSTDASIEAKIQELEAEKSVLEEELTLKQKDLEAAKALAEGKMLLEDTSAQYLTDLRANLTKYFIDLGLDEVAANKAALETMGLNEQTYSDMVANACETNATNMTYAAEDGANAQSDALTQIVQRWGNFATYLKDNIGPLLREIGAAILDPKRTIKDVMLSAWDSSAISIDSSGSNNYSSSSGDYVFKSGDLTQLTAVRQGVANAQLESVNAIINDLTAGINSLDGQIDYLKALKDQDLGDFGETDVDDVRDLGKALADLAERYHEITREITAQEHALDKLSKEKDKAFGSDKLKFIDEEIKGYQNLYEEQNKLYLLRLADLALDQQKLQEDFGGKVDFNTDTNEINNYTELYNSATEEQRKLLEDYEKSLDALRDQEDTLYDIASTLQSLNLEKITVEVDSGIEINDRDLNKLDYIVDKLGRNLNSMVEQIEVLGDQVNKQASKGQWAMSGIDRIKANAAAENRDLTDDEQRQIWEYEDILMDTNTALLDIVDTIENSLMEEFERLNEEIDENISRFDAYTETLDHFQNILRLSGRGIVDSATILNLAGQKTDLAMQKFNSTNDKYKTQQGVLNETESKLNAAKSSGDEDEIKYWQEQYDKQVKIVEQTHNEMLQSWEDVLQAASEQFDLAIETTIQTLKDSISEFGLEGLSDRYEKATEAQDRYLSNLDKEYELNKMSRDIQNSIDETDNVNAKQKLLKLQDELNEKLASGEKMSKYDLEHLQKKYDLELAKIALEEAQNAKSTVRLSRDSEGNFGYVYTADQDAIDDAQQNYEDKLYNLQKHSQEYLDEMSGAIIQNQEEMMEALVSIDRTKFTTEAEYQAEVNRIKEYYLGRDKDLRAEMEKAMRDTGVVYSETILGQIEGSENLDQAQQKLKQNTDTATSEMVAAWVNWKDTVDDAAAEGGTSAENMAKDFTNASNDVSKAGSDLAKDIDEQTTEMSGYIDKLIKKIWEWRDEFIGSINTMILKHDEYLGINNNELTDNPPPKNDNPPPKNDDVPPDAEPPKQDDTGSGEPTIGQKKYISEPAHYDASGAKDSTYPPAKTGGEMYLVGIHEGSKYPYGVSWRKGGTRYGWVSSFDTGGYTGNWGPEGKLAVLHEKEMVLNKQDTSNLLSTISFIRDIISMIDTQASTMSSMFNMQATSGVAAGNETLEQTVTIHAEFPNATNHNEIEEAFNNLINTASQYANRK